MRKARRSLLALLPLLVIPAAFAAPQTETVGAKPPKEEGLYLVLSGDETVRLPRFAGKPCGAVTAGLPKEASKDGMEKFVYVPAGVLAQIPVVASKRIRGGYFVTADEKLQGLRNLVFLEPYLAGRKLVAGTYENGCAEGEIGNRNDFLAFSAWGWSFDRVLRATYVDQATTRLEILSARPFAAGKTRPIAGPEDERIAAFGIFIATDKHYYPFLPDAKLVGFLAEALARPAPDGLPPRVLELAAKLEKYLETAGESADPAAREVVAAVHRRAKGRAGKGFAGPAS